MNSNSTGMHWFCLIKRQKTADIDFFDSLGMPSSFYGKELELFLKQNGARINYHDKNVQNFKSTTCGQHCCFFISKRFKGFSFKHILNLYSNNTNKNDAMVRKVINLKKFPKFTCKSRCYNNIFTNICFQKSRRCYNFK